MGPRRRAPARPAPAAAPRRPKGRPARATSAPPRRRRPRAGRWPATCAAGKIEDRKVEIEVTVRPGPPPESLGHMPFDDAESSLGDWLAEALPPRKKKRRVEVAEAREILFDDEVDRLIDHDKVVTEALDRAENTGIVFIDEIDKIAAAAGATGPGPDVSRAGVQRDLLPVVEGTNVPTRYGMVRTDHMLFIAAGAFHHAKPSDLIPELQGRFPIRVELSALTEDDFVRILTEPENAPLKQYKALLAADGTKLVVRLRRGARDRRAGGAPQRDEREHRRAPPADRAGHAARGRALRRARPEAGEGRDHARRGAPPRGRAVHRPGHGAVHPVKRAPARRIAACAVLVALVAGGCARKLPPTGGPRDVLPPDLLSIEPDSGATGVDTSAVIRLVFSEAMDRASVETGLLVAPGVRGGTFEWSGGRTVTFRPDRPLRASTVHTMLLVAGVRDARGNVVDRPFAVHFTTGTAFGAGGIEGRRRRPRGHPRGGLPVGLPRGPGPGARLHGARHGRAGPGARRGAVPLRGPGGPRHLPARTRSSIAPATARSSPPRTCWRARRASWSSRPTPRWPRDIRVIAVDPEALARVEGAVLDSLSPGTAPLRVEVRGIPLDPVAAVDRAPVLILDVREGRFAGNLRAGRWRLTGFRDLDDDRVLAPSEPRSQTVEIDLEPAGRAAELTLVLAASP